MTKRRVRTTTANESKTMTRQCSECEFFETDGNTAQGECRYDAPRSASKGEYGSWPLVTIRRWCGKFEPRDKPAEPEAVVMIGVVTEAYLSRDRC